MSETTDSGDKKLTLSGRKTLQLKQSVDAGQVRQSLSHGRGKSVVVERKRRRLIAVETDEKLEVEEAPVAEVTEEPAAPDAPIDHLTKDERAVRARVLEEARKDAELRAKEDAIRQTAELEALEKAAQEKALRDADAESESDEEVAQEAETSPQAEAETEPAPLVIVEPPVVKEDGIKPGSKMKPVDRKAREAEDDERSEGRRRGAGDRPKQRPTPRTEPRRRDSKLTIARALDDDGAEERQRSLAAVRRAREKQKAALRDSNEPMKKITREVVVPESITIGELANRMAVRAADVIRELMKMGDMVTVNEVIDADTAELIVTEMGHKVRRVTEADVETGLYADDDDESDMQTRSPVVTVMGHVDHGKTSLLDALRATDVVSGEAGGITQHIGAYQIELKSGAKITFLDTPGHAAFTAMRARGAQATDIIILVVAADDGIMPQTIEAIQHAKAADVPMIVAINKIDTPGANPDKVRQDLLQHEVIVEEMGGEVLNIEVSATEGTNLDKLEEIILLQSELMDLKANPDRSAEGIVVEATLDKGRGPVATILVQRGTIRVGDIFVAGAESGRVRALIDDKGNQLTEAGPSQPVEVLGLGGLPAAGEDFVVVESENRAREITEYRQRQRKNSIDAGPRASLESMLERLKVEAIREMPVVIKADVNGSAEAIAGALEQLNTDEVAAKIILSGVGGISESDVTLAEASGAPILAFNVRAAGKARSQAEAQGVEIRYYSVIYDLVDDVKSTLSGMLAPEIIETILGTADVKEVFSAGKGKAAGCIVTDGIVQSGAKARLLRDSVVVFDGKIGSVRRFKDEVAEVNAGTECGITIENFNDIKDGDVIEVYEVEERVRSL